MDSFKPADQSYRLVKIINNMICWEFLRICLSLKNPWPSEDGYAVCSIAAPYICFRIIPDHVVVWYWEGEVSFDLLLGIFENLRRRFPAVNHFKLLSINPLINCSEASEKRTKCKTRQPKLSLIFKILLHAIQGNMRFRSILQSLLCNPPILCWEQVTYQLQMNVPI